MEPTVLAEIRAIMRGGRPTKPRRDEEFGLQRFVIDSLRLFGVPGIVSFHVNNGSKLSKRAAARAKAMGVLPGVADIVVVGPLPNVWFLELKSSTGRLSDAQEVFRDAVVALGWEYRVASTPEAACNVLLQWGVLREDPLKRAGEGA